MKRNIVRQRERESQNENKKKLTKGKNTEEIVKRPRKEQPTSPFSRGPTTKDSKP